MPKLAQARVCSFINLVVRQPDSKSSTSVLVCVSRETQLLKYHKRSTTPLCSANRTRRASNFMCPAFGTQPLPRTVLTLARTRRQRPRCLATAQLDGDTRLTWYARRRSPTRTRSRRAQSNLYTSAASSCTALFEREVALHFRVDVTARCALQRRRSRCWPQAVLRGLRRTERHT